MSCHNWAAARLRQQAALNYSNGSLYTHRTVRIVTCDPRFMSPTSPIS